MRHPSAAAPPRLGLPNLGFGVGLRPKHYPHILAHGPAVDWFEIISENFIDHHGYARHALDRIAALRPVVMHGVSLSIGSASPLDRGYLDKLKALAGELRPAWISDHLCWTGTAGVNTHDLLPLPLTEETLRHVIERVRVVQDHLERPLVLENPSSYLEFSCSTMPEWEFLSTVAVETGCGILLDVNNVHVSAHNHRFDPEAYVRALPHEHVVQIHVAGPTDRGDLLIDTHDHPVPAAVWRLYALAQELTGGVSTLLEWDADIPEYPDLLAELDKARGVLAGRFPDVGPGAPRGHEAVSTPIDFHLGSYDGGSPLREVQAWLVTVMLAPGGAAQGARFAAERSGLRPEALIASPGGASREARLHVYASGYAARLVDCLAADFPALRRVMSEPLFDFFARAYVASCPSTSPTLFDLGEGFPDFLASTQARSGRADVDAARLAFPLDLARLERARSEASRAPGTEGARAATPDLVALFAGEALRASTPPCLRLLALSHPLKGLIEAVDRGDEELTLPDPAPSFLAVTRSSYRLRMLELDPWQFAFLSAAAGERNVYECAGEAAREAQRPLGSILAELLLWLPAMESAGTVLLSREPA